MCLRTLPLLAVFILACSPKPTPTPAPVEPVEPAEPAPKAEIQVTPLQHGSLLLSVGDLVIAIDPVTAALEARAADAPRADAVLITHLHGDHYDPKAVAALRKDGAPVVMPASVAEKAEIDNPTILANGASAALLGGALGVEAVPMYNVTRTRPNGQVFHPKGWGNGYVLTLAGERIYISGDTECTPEMKALQNIDRAFVCMNLPYTMIPTEAAACVRAFRPKILYPYHYRGQDPSVLSGLLQDVPGVTVKQLEWYPKAP